MQVKRKRLEKFKSHATKILSPYVNSIYEGQTTDLGKLAKALNGILYQYIGDEDRFLDRDISKLQAQINCLEETIDQYNNMSDEEKDFLVDSNDCDKVEKEKRVITGHLAQLIFKVINKEKPNFFFYLQKNKEQDLLNPPDDFMTAEDFDNSEPPEELGENPDVDTEK